MCIYDIRPHHALCARFFAGHGYSAEFTKNMARVLKLMESDPRVRLVSGADEICAACPNLNGGVCAAADKVKRYDAKVLSLCGLNCGDAPQFSELRRAADEKIIFAGKLDKVCPDCQWRNICADAAARLRENQHG